MADRLRGLAQGNIVPKNKTTRDPSFTKKEGVDDYASTYSIGAAAILSRYLRRFCPGHIVIVTVRHQSRMDESNLVLVPSNTNTTKVIRPESKLSALPNIFELDKPDSSFQTGRTPSPVQIYQTVRRPTP